MADIWLFLQQGWRNIWKQTNIFLFAALGELGTLILPMGNRLAEPLSKTAPLLYLIILGIQLFLFVYLLCAGQAATIFTAYSAASNEPASFDTAWDIARTTWRKMALLWLVVFLLILPFLCVIVAVSSAVALGPARTAPYVYVFSIAFAAFGALWSFATAGIVTEGLGVRRSIASAWRRFSRHFASLAGTGVILQVAFYVLLFVVTSAATLVRSGFDVRSLQGISFFPAFTSNRDVAYWVGSAAVAIASQALNAAVFMAAYVKYGKGKRGKAEG